VLPEVSAECLKSFCPHVFGLSGSSNVCSIVVMRYVTLRYVIIRGLNTVETEIRHAMYFLQICLNNGYHFNYGRNAAVTVYTVSFNVKQRSVHL
jgi:hypothetical protein